MKIMDKQLLLAGVVVFLFLIGVTGHAGEGGKAPALVEDFEVMDNPSDEGKKILLRWKKSADVDGGERDVLEYVVTRSTTPEGPFEEVKDLPPHVVEWKDETVDDGVKYWYRIKVRDVYGNESVSDVVGPAVPSAQIINTRRLVVLYGMVLFFAIVLICVFMAKGGREFFVRRISGLEALDEALGRATEMGRPVLYVTGLGSVGDIATLASINILGRVARKVAEYETPLIVPNNDPLVMIVEREVVKQAYSEAGKPDAYKEDSVFFLTGSQFAYAAAVDGIMLRERPAANFYLGYFAAESLILAETGASTGAIQIAGTDAVTQIPFFIAACDYTLIGEELYAASAYLSREPLSLGALKAQDWGKVVMVTLIVVGILLELCGVHFAECFMIQE